MKKRAFTLIELIIVLAIISISSLMLIFRFSVIDKIGAENEVKTFVNDYSYARDKALSSGQRIEIVFSSSGYSIGKTNRDLKYVKSFYVNTIIFYPNGYVNVNKTKKDHNIKFVSNKDSQKYWSFTIQAVGGYINENK